MPHLGEAQDCFMHIQNALRMQFQEFLKTQTVVPFIMSFLFTAKLNFDFFF